MQVVLDTHALLWWFLDSQRLTRLAYQEITKGTNGVHVSAASIWEISTKYYVGKLPAAKELLLDIQGYMASQNFVELPVTISDAIRAGSLPGPHRDPFDRMLIAQAISNDLVLISNETLFDRYGVRRLW